MLITNYVYKIKLYDEKDNVTLAELNKQKEDAERMLMHAELCNKKLNSIIAIHEGRE